MVGNTDTKATPTIRDLYPNLSDAELEEAEITWERYITLVLRIFERMEFEAQPQPDQLTADIGTLPFNQAGPKSSD